MGEGPEEGLVGWGRTGGGVSGWGKDRRRWGRDLRRG